MTDARALLHAPLGVPGSGRVRYGAAMALFREGRITDAAGQVLYRHLVARHPSDLPHYARFGYFYLGALLVVLIARQKQ